MLAPEDAQEVIGDHIRDGQVPVPRATCDARRVDDVVSPDQRIVRREGFLVVHVRVPDRFAGHHAFVQGLRVDRRAPGHGDDDRAVLQGGPDEITVDHTRGTGRILNGDDKDVALTHQLVQADLLGTHAGKPFRYR
ncbi:hypothetical protein V7793_10795 [Streptomyces sp. KLMMK]